MKKFCCNLGGYTCKNIENFNGTIYNEFRCPLEGFEIDYIYCCGDTDYQYCCTFFDEYVILNKFQNFNFYIFV
jgi:hypothetical protein